MKVQTLECLVEELVIKERQHRKHAKLQYVGEERQADHCLYLIRRIEKALSEDQHQLIFYHGRCDQCEKRDTKVHTWEWSAASGELGYHTQCQPCFKAVFPTFEFTPVMQFEDDIPKDQQEILDKYNQQ